MSDLLREQLVLRSEITDDSSVPPSRRSSQSFISVQGEEGEQREGTYRASISITPATPPRANTHTEEEEEKKEERESNGEQAVNEPEVEGAVGGVKVDNLQQLIKQVMIQIWVLSSATEVMSLPTCFTETFSLLCSRSERAWHRRSDRRSTASFWPQCRIASRCCPRGNNPRSPDDGFHPSALVTTALAAAAAALPACKNTV